MSDVAETITPAFSIAQLETFMAWSAKRPRGFRVAIHHDHECAEEMAEVTQRAAHEFLYYLHPTPAGRITMSTADGRATWETDTVEEALAALLIEEEELEAEWMSDTR